MEDKMETRHIAIIETPRDGIRIDPEHGECCDPYCDYFSVTIIGLACTLQRVNPLHQGEPLKQNEILSGPKKIFFSRNAFCLGHAKLITS
jgi:hypothetical protein